MARHEINVPAGNGQAGKAPDSSVKVPSSSPDRRNFYYYNIRDANSELFCSAELMSIAYCLRIYKTSDYWIPAMLCILLTMLCIITVQWCNSIPTRRSEQTSKEEQWQRHQQSLEKSICELEDSLEKGKKSNSSQSKTLKHLMQTKKRSPLRCILLFSVHHCTCTLYKVMWNLLN